MTLWYVLSFLISTLAICSFLYLRLNHQLLKEIDQFLIDETTEMVVVLSEEHKETYSLMKFEDDVMTESIIPTCFRSWTRAGRFSIFQKAFGPSDMTPKARWWPTPGAGKRPGREFVPRGEERPIVSSAPLFIRIGSSLKSFSWGPISAL